MNYLIDTYLRKPEYVDRILNSNVQISLKVDGAALQIEYDRTNDKIIYHSRGGNISRLGPIIDDYQRLFRKNINDAIDVFDSKKNIISKNKFYAIEMIGNMFVLLAIIDHNDNLITDVDKLRKIADELNIDYVPILHTGKLTNTQKLQLLDLTSLDENTDNSTFVDSIRNILKDKIDNNVNKFLKSDEMEGIVITCNIDDKNEQLKIINPAFKMSHKKRTEEQNNVSDEEIESVNTLIIELYNILDEIGEHLDDVWLRNLDKNLINMFDNERCRNRLIELSSKIKYVRKDFWSLQVDRLPNDVRKLLDEYGQQFNIIYETYLRVFYKQRKRNFIISKDFGTKVNNLIERLRNINEHKRYVSLIEYIAEAKKRI